jgi:hypothetical protein
MSCCNNNPTGFSNLTNTWSSKSDLRPSDYYPYREFIKPLTNYDSCYKKDNVEKYRNPQTNPTNYNILDKSWEPQQRYQL